MCKIAKYESCSYYWAVKTWCSCVTLSVAYLKLIIYIFKLLKFIECIPYMYKTFFYK